MKALLNDDEYFDAFFNTLPRVKAYHDAFDAILRANEDITGALAIRKAVFASC